MERRFERRTGVANRKLIEADEALGQRLASAPRVVGPSGLGF